MNEYMRQCIALGDVDGYLRQVEGRRQYHRSMDKAQKARMKRCDRPSTAERVATAQAEAAHRRIEGRKRYVEAMSRRSNSRADMYR